MSWMSQLYKTYERNAGSASDQDDSMTPISHRNVNAQIEVTLNLDGEFLGAREIEKEHAVTLIPVTEASAGRTSGIVPHALCDMLPYVAGDFEQYCKGNKEKKNSEEKFTQFIDLLQKWCESENSHPKAKAVFAYLSRKRLIADLVDAGVVKLTENRMFSDKKVAGQPYEKALVRFRVLGDESGPDATWEDGSLIKAYIAYYLKNQQGREDICYLLGEEKTISENHPKGIVAANYGAKLVSANDNQGYTYRGRFQSAEQSCALSYEASQKIHSALTWLVKNQGAYVGSKDKRMFVCWSPSGNKVPDVFDELELIADEADDQIPYKKKLIKAFQGYRNQFSRKDEVIVMGLDAATTGRLSVTYYNELMANDFLDRMIRWGETCCWFYDRFHEKGTLSCRVETPTFQRIVKCAYGREGEKYIEVDDRILKEQVQRLLKCMLEQQPVPFDLVQAIASRASNPLAYSRTNRERVLSTACAIIAKYHYKGNEEQEGERNDMRLDQENRDRSYLFGRLLAIGEKVERMTYERGETREPNAIRLQSAFTNHPLQTWRILYEQLEPYFRKLYPKKREEYRTQIGEVMSLFQEEDEQKLNQSLKETYLLGYFLQRMELNKKKEEQKEVKENE